jgi:trigger factor
MKSELVDVTVTQKSLVVEIPSGVVDAEIDRVARDYSRAARVPGFRPGKVPARVVKQRFRQQILHDVAHELIPRAVDEALRERGVEPVEAPDIRDVLVEEGHPLKFTASFETVPPIDPGEYRAIGLRRSVARVTDEAVEDALARLRDRAARYEPVESRPVASGDSIVADLDRRGRAGDKAGEVERHENVTIEIGASANPPGFDDELTGLEVGAEKAFSTHYPGDYAIHELAGTDVDYRITLKSIKRRVVPDLDDEFAKDLGDFASLDALRDRIRQDLQRDAERAADRDMRADLLKQLATRVAFEIPSSLVEREIDRRVEEFVRRLLEQQIDPRRTNIDWEEFRRSQREMAVDAVKGALVLDEVARREGMTVTEGEIDAEVTRYAERSERTPAAVRAQLEKDDGIGRLSAGLRREHAIDFLVAHATRIDATHD